MVYNWLRIYYITGKEGKNNKNPVKYDKQKDRANPGRNIQ